MRPLESHVDAAAAVRNYGGTQLVARFSSVAREVDACRRSVGLVDRSDLTVAALRASGATLARMLGGLELETDLGRAAVCDRVLCLRIARDEAIVLASLSERCALRRRLAGAVPAVGDARVTDVTDSTACISVIGPRADRLLSACRLAPPPSVGCISLGEDFALVRENGQRFLLLIGASNAASTWARLCVCGHPLGADLVGFDALALLDRSRWSELGSPHAGSMNPTARGGVRGSSDSQPPLLTASQQDPAETVELSDIHAPARAPRSAGRDLAARWINAP
jgi:hypothetical protein